MGIILSQIFHTFKFFIVCWIFKNNLLDKFQVNQIYLKQTKIIQDVMSINYQKK
jgi:hypothetical protein